jgi:hypothetical protein
MAEFRKVLGTCGQTVLAVARPAERLLRSATQSPSR